MCLLVACFYYVFVVYMCIHRRVLLHVLLYALDCFAFVVFFDVDCVEVLLFRVCVYVYICAY